jgi:hypothetical protein
MVTYSISGVCALFCFGTSFDKEATKVGQIRRLLYFSIDTEIHNNRSIPLFLLGLWL